MANIKVRDLADTTNISMANQLMVLTNEQNNIVQNITVENFNAGIISSESDNGLSQDDNGKLFVNNADSGVVAGVYEYPKNLQVNSKGQILSVEQGQEANVPIATTANVGVVKPDGLTIEITQDGTISSNNLGNEVGDIIWRLLPSNDAGKHLLDGTLLNAGSYSGFVNYIADLYADNPNANYFTDETTWQATVAQYGACGKFVYDSTNNTVRLPKVTGIVEGTIDATALGDLITAGLPNITGNAAVTTDNGALMTGAFSWTNRTNNLVIYNPSGSYPWGTLTLDASQSSSIYGNSSTVQPQTIKGYYYIVVATSTKTDIQVDIDEIATDLNDKADVDLTNTTNQAKILMSGMAMPSNKYINLTLGASGATYTAPANGYIFWTQRLPANNGMWVLVNDNQNQYIYGKSLNSSTTSATTIFLPVMKGYRWSANYTGGTVEHYRFIYAQGSESEAS